MKAINTIINRRKEWYPHSNMLRLLAVILIYSLSVTSPVCAGTSAIFVASNEKTGEIIDRSYLKIKHINAEEVYVNWRVVNNQEGDFVHNYWLNKDGTTRRWHINYPSKKIDYTGERIGNRLVISGVFEGRPISKSLRIDAAPFYFNPKVGLRTFVTSSQQELVCWTFVSSRLKPYRMQIKKGKKEVIQFKGQPMDVIEVVWEPASIFYKYFKQVFFFRASDGQYVTQQPYKGYQMDWIQ